MDTREWSMGEKFIQKLILTLSVATLCTGNCYYYRLENANANGGMLVYDKLTEAQCRYECVARTGCVAADYNRGSSECFIYVNRTSVALWSACCTRFQQICDIEGLCQDTFTVFQGREGTGASSTWVPTADLGTCRQACLSLPSCLGFDWRKSPQPDGSENCRIYAAAPGTLSSPTFDHYSRLACLPPSEQLATTTPMPPTPAAGACVRDIVFIVDSSGSITEPNNVNYEQWMISRGIVSDLISGYLTVSPYYDRVSLVSFSNEAYLIFNITRHMSNAAVLSAIETDLHYIGGTTNTPAAIQIAVNVLRSRTPDNRRPPLVSTVVVLVSDGWTTPALVNYGPLQQLVDLASYRLAVGVTQNISRESLANFSTDPTRIIQVRSESERAMGVNNISLRLSEICATIGPDITRRPTTEFSNQTGGCVRDVVFILDNSGSITDPDLANKEPWELALELLQTLVRTSLGVGKEGDRVALITFTTEAKLRFDLDDHVTGNDVISALQNVVYVGGHTNTPEGIQFAVNLLKDPSRGSRLGSAVPIVIIITDGWTTDFDNNNQPLEDLKAIPGNVRIAVGITKNISREGLRNFTSSEDRISYLVNPADLTAALNMLEIQLNLACQPTNLNKDSLKSLTESQEDNLKLEDPLKSGKINPDMLSSSVTSPDPEFSRTHPESTRTYSDHESTWTHSDPESARANPELTRIHSDPESTRTNPESTRTHPGPEFTRTVSYGKESGG